MERSRSRSRRWSNKSTISDLPEDILIDILSRLSIKSVVSCRCVSKTWRDLLSSSNTQFTKLHFNRSPLQLIFVKTNGCLGFVEMEDDTDLDNNNNNNMIKPIPSRFRLSRCNLVVINSCNGFLCLAPRAYYSPVKICNPITGEYINLPKHKMYDYNDTDVVSGFGFCANTNQYKVVRLVHKKGMFKHRVIEVFTIGTKSWRNVGTAPEYPHFSFCTIFFNGKIHWVSDDSGCSDYIISFDLETEELGNVPPPPRSGAVPRTWMDNIKIGVLGESLCVSYNTELWMMERYGDHKSWTNIVDRMPVDSHQAIKYLSGGKILMNYDLVKIVSCDLGKLVSYDPVGKVSKEFKVPQSRWRLKAIAHVPSFMSFNDAMMADQGAKLRTRMCRVQLKRRK